MGKHTKGTKIVNHKTLEEPNSVIDEKAEKKYADIYKALREEDRTLADEMNSSTLETMPMKNA